VPDTFGTQLTAPPYGGTCKIFPICTSTVVRTTFFEPSPEFFSSLLEDTNARAMHQNGGRAHRKGPFFNNR
jgi:hypothetical protein